MRPAITAFALATGLSGLAAAHGQHDHDHVVDTKEPFIGWTQEDLDAKWGTDVCLPLQLLNISLSPPLVNHSQQLTYIKRSGASVASQPLPTSLTPDACNTPKRNTTSPSSAPPSTHQFPTVPVPDSDPEQSVQPVLARQVSEATTREPVSTLTKNGLRSSTAATSPSRPLTMPWLYAR